MSSDDERTSAATQQFLPVWCGMGLREWLRLLALRPPMHPSRIGRIAGVTAAACVNSMLHVFERAIHDRKIARTRIERPPLFILGHWRSGTTLLHNLLARDPRFVAPTTYQTSFPGHFLLTERWVTAATASRLPERRPMDEMPFHWHLPGEDEIALLLMTLHSPYLRAAFPNGSMDINRLDDLRRGLSQKELTRWKAAFLRFLKTVAGQTDRILLLKSPAHTGRIPLLLELFPEARFLYVVRNPYEVFSSTRHLQRVLIEMNTFGLDEPANLEDRILSVYSRLYDAYHMHRALVPPARRVELRYEDLVADPVRSLNRIYDHFGFDGFEMVRPTFEADLPALRSHRKNRYVLDEATKRRVFDRWRPAFTRYGYTAE